jgi:hypothetical protein
MTTNLQEMIQPYPNVSEASLPEIMDSNYQPETEQALIDYVVSQNNKLEIANIFVQWEIGRSINSFYKGKYGTNGLGKISEATGIGRDTLAKACKFAKQYSKEHVDMLLKGNFVISWAQIAPHLAVEPQKVIETYQISPDPKQFYYGIIKLKNPAEVRGKSKPPKIVEAKDTSKPIIAVPVIIPDDPAIVEYDEDPPIPAEYDDGQEVRIDQINQDYEKYSKELEALRIENQQLKKIIAENNEQVNSLHTMMKEDATYIDENDRIIEAYRERFKRLRFMIENSFSVGAIMELLVAVE